ncbi:MAG: hypothetical protein C0524_07810 [Rhodobacter sp.]|nr:hypothetical protein [Rhodobacter sp.]
MNKGTLPIIARLQSLQSAARVAPGGARVIASISDQSPLAALLREVNETMLGRALAFESSNGTSLTLEVSGRRVLRLTAANGLSGVDSCLSAQALEDEHKDDLIKLLQSVAAPRCELRVSASRIGREREEVSIGLPVALLADLLLIDLNLPEAASEPGLEPEPPPELEPKALPRSKVRLPPAASEPGPGLATGPMLGRFARGCSPALIAWLIVGGEEDGTTDGPEEMISHLQGFLEVEGEALSLQLDQISTEPGTPVCIQLGATLTEGHSILCARSGEGFLLGVIEGDGTQTLMRAWAAALA